MYARDFCYWLQGWLEVQEPKEVTAGQLDTIKAHLTLTFHHDLEPPETDSEANNHLFNSQSPDGKTFIKC